MLDCVKIFLQNGLCLILVQVIKREIEKYDYRDLSVTNPLGGLSGLILKKTIEAEYIEMEEQHGSVWLSFFLFNI